MPMLLSHSHRPAILKNPAITPTRRNLSPGSNPCPGKQSPATNPLHHQSSQIIPHRTARGRNPARSHPLESSTFPIPAAIQRQLPTDHHHPHPNPTHISIVSRVTNLENRFPGTTLNPPQRATKKHDLDGIKM